MVVSFGDASYMRWVSFEYYELIKKHAAIVRYTDYSVLTKKQLLSAKADGIPEVMLAYGRQRNGDLLEWQAHSGLGLTGCINLLPLQQIYRSPAPDELYIAADDEPELHQFRPVDIFKADACIGLLHNDQRSPRLVYFDENDRRVVSLEVDIQGYMSLLMLSLGFLNWQSLLVELASPRGQIRPFTLEADTVHCNILRRILPVFAQVFPAFDLNAFVDCYDQVKLPTTFQ
jgi:hypothetical protein